LKYKYSELEYVEEECKEGNVLFEEHYRQFCSENNISISELESKNKEKVKIFGPKTTPISANEAIEKSVSPEESKRKKVFQRIFHGIAKKIHPDKFSSVERTIDIIEKEETFKKATYAFENEKWGLLLEIADALDIHPQKYQKINSLLRDEISDVNKKINGKQKSFGWHMSQAETEDQKDKVVISFLKNLFDYVFKP